MSHYLILIHPPVQADDAADRAAHDQHADELAADGTIVAAYALQPGARTVRAGGVTDGPFLETKEIVAGIYVVQAPDFDAAVAIAGRNPVVREGCGVEVREIESGTVPG
ncbi:YciI family protein [Jiangella endophytica]|uniref:YciI family protein n=1 Tax=Jiangella endophytica TaxID=1623398 RepID=UPI000E355DF7|nr:YciI family protein [Jiangella endophytica]